MGLEERVKNEFKYQELSISGSGDNDADHDHHSTFDFLDPTKIVINHNGCFYPIWSSVINYLCMFSSYYYIHMAAFKHQGEESLIMVMVMESLFLFDFLIHFITSF
jgi:hypothetical protein